MSTDAIPHMLKVFQVW